MVGIVRVPNVYYCGTVYCVHYVYIRRGRLFCAAKQSIMMKDIRIILILSIHTRTQKYIKRTSSERFE